MEFQTCDAVNGVAAILAVAYQRCRRTRRIEIGDEETPGAVNRELDNQSPVSPHAHEVDA